MIIGGANKSENISVIMFNVYMLQTYHFVAVNTMVNMQPNVQQSRKILTLNQVASTSTDTL